MVEIITKEKKLMTLQEMRGYLGIGETKAREIINSPNCNFRVRIGNRLYANRTLLDKWIDSISGRR